MKGFLVLLVLSAAGLAGVLYFRKAMRAPSAPVVASAEPTVSKERRHRRRHGARRLARHAVPAGQTAGDAPPAVGDPAPSEGPTGDGTRRVFDDPSEGPAPLPGGAAVSEAPPDDVFGPMGPSPSAPSTGGDRRAAPEPAPVKLRPGDLKMVWQGDDHLQAETMRLDMSNDNGHDLTDNEIDARFRTKEDAILGCIARSRPNEETDVPGRVTVKFRILKTGAVKGVQVEAPVILHKGGLTGCIKNTLASLKFPASNGGQVVSFPFSLM